MKLLFQLVLLGALGYAGYYYYENFIQAEPEPPPPRGPLTITCPTCAGEGRLTYVDLRGRNHRYPCKVCGFMGSRTFDLPEGAHACPDCKGMGRYEVRQARRDVRGGYILDASRCQRCAAAGFIQPRSPPGRRTPTL